MVLTLNFGPYRDALRDELYEYDEYRDALLGRHTIFGIPLTNVKMLSSLNITFLHSAAFQCRYFWQKFDVFFIAAVSISFLAARQHGGQRFYRSK